MKVCISHIHGGRRKPRKKGGEGKKRGGRKKGRDWVGEIETIPHKKNLKRKGREMGVFQQGKTGGKNEKTCLFKKKKAIKRKPYKFKKRGRNPSNLEKKGIR